MEEILTNGEQPDVSSLNEQHAHLKAGNENENQIPAEETSALYGKFKDGAALLSAYNSLQAEFTRKSQKLSELTKENEGLKQNDFLPVNASDKNKESLSQDAGDPAYEAGTAVVDNNGGLGENTASDNDRWRDKVNGFFAGNPELKSISLEIGKVLIKNPELKKLDNCLDVASKIVLSNKYKKPEDLIKDTSFVNEYVLSNSEIRKFIIDEYVSGLNKTAIPKTISGTPTKLSKADLKSRPASISEAGAIAKKYFN